MINSEFSKHLPLVTFASALEFLGVFQELPVPYKEPTLLPSGNAYGVVLGVGLLEFSTNLASILSKKNFSEVFQLGICGAFLKSGLELGDVVYVESEIVGDLGVEENDGSFVPWNSIQKNDSLVYRTSLNSELPSWIKQLKKVSGITVNTCSGTSKTAEIRKSIFNAQVETMEGAAVMAVCSKFNIPSFEIRAVSNFVANRDKSSWKIQEALNNLKIVMERDSFL